MISYQRLCPPHRYLLVGFGTDGHAVLRCPTCNDKQVVLRQQAQALTRDGSQVIW
jgi:hypothetical protein